MKREQDADTIIRLFAAQVIQHRIGIGTAARMAGIESHRSGSGIVADCPFCGAKDKLSLNKAGGIFYCFYCRRSGDTFDLIGAVQNKTFQEVLVDLIKFDESKRKKRSIFDTDEDNDADGK